MKKYIFLAIAVVTVRGLYGQNQADTHLSAFAGKYQSANDKMTFLQISAKDSGLLLRQLWDNQEIAFSRTGGLTFYNDEHSFPLVFTRDSLGKITQVLAFDRDVWKKVPDSYQPEMQKIIKLPPERLKAFDGKYKLQGGDDAYITITAEADHLVLTQLWDQQQIVLRPVSALEFFNDKQNFPVKFVPDANGAVNQITIFNRDQWMRVN
jgi:hypothetical protein